MLGAWFFEVCSFFDVLLFCHIGLKCRYVVFQDVDGVLIKICPPLD